MEQFRDIAGSVCSGLCLCHCVAGPLLLAAGGAGTLGVLLTGEWVHWLLLIPVWWLALSSFPRGYLQHRRTAPLVAGAMGILAITAATFSDNWMETLSTIVGALCLIYAHMSNRRLIKRRLATT